MQYRLLNKFKISLVAILINTCVFCQTINIDGSLTENIQNDSIYFVSPSNLKSDYFEKAFFSSAIDNDHFTITGKFSYPQLFRMRLKSETNVIPFRRGFYFIDQSTKSIFVDSEKIIGKVKSKTGDEFEKIFTPYFIKQVNNENNIDAYFNNKQNEFENKLTSYIQKYPNSYVALWFLIIDFSKYGYSEKRLQILHSFSNKMKSVKLWKMLESDFKGIRIKVNEKFPKLHLKNIDLQFDTLTLPKAKFTLIDFWFCRCKPCLTQLPSIIKIYEKYNSKGFNVIGISSDKTENISLWQKRIAENRIPWENYLDENATECFIEKIFEFPTNYLIDTNGVIIQKNIEPDQLEKFLLENI
jgi:thiol-disulfide isomerase/thioredoxin